MIKEKRSVALISVFAAIFLTGFKLIIGIVTGSLGILSEALHSGLDLVAAVITFFSVSVSDKPADKNYNYGHGKIENFSALLETILLLITCGWIIYEAITRLVSGNTHIEVNVWSYVVIISSIIIDINRSRMLSRVAKKYNSQALEADALHFSTDIWSSSVVLLGLVCANFGFFFADSIAALGVAFIVLFVCYRLGKRSIDVLLDKAPLQTINKIELILGTFSEVKHFHSLKVRTAGADTFVRVVVTLEGQIMLYQAHEICDKLEKEICAVINRCDVFVHAEPHFISPVQTGQIENQKNQKKYDQKIILE
jgi:cation diffusion facilitator family transporter